MKSDIRNTISEELKKILKEDENSDVYKDGIKEGISSLITIIEDFCKKNYLDIHRNILRPILYKIKNIKYNSYYDDDDLYCSSDLYIKDLDKSTYGVLEGYARYVNLRVLIAYKRPSDGKERISLKFYYEFETDFSGKDVLGYICLYEDGKWSYKKLL